jgi:hypothetical protein
MILWGYIKAFDEGKQVQVWLRKAGMWGTCASVSEIVEADHARRPMRVVTPRPPATSIPLQAEDVAALLPDEPTTKETIIPKVEPDSGEAKTAIAPCQRCGDPAAVHFCKPCYDHLYGTDVEGAV